MSKVVFSGLSADVLSYWRVTDDSRVFWRTPEEGAALGLAGKMLSKLSAPAGAEAGYQFVFGRGAVVNCSSRRVLTCDIIAAIRAGYFWRWGPDIEHDMIHVPPNQAECQAVFSQARHSQVEHHGSVDDAARGIAAATWSLDPEHGLVWRVSPHESRPVGSPAGGSLLVGGEYVISRKGLGFVKSDVVFALEHGRWPWQEAVNWDD